MTCFCGSDCSLDFFIVSEPPTMNIGIIIAMAFMLIKVYTKYFPNATFNLSSYPDLVSSQHENSHHSAGPDHMDPVLSPV